MAATTVAIPTTMRRESEPKEGETVYTAVTVYAGAMGGFNASGFIVPPGAGVNGIGICDPRWGPSASAGERVKMRYGDALMPVDAGETISDDDIGKIAYAKNNQDISLNAGEGVPCGIITGTDAGKVWVNFDPAHNFIDAT